MITPDAVNIVYMDRMFDVETELYLTEFDKKNVFAGE